MIWLRHEVWEHEDGLSYRLASKAETERLASAHPEGVIKHVFYAPSPATAVAQYYALRQLGPYVPGAEVSQHGFTAAQLESQIADFPEDEVLSGQLAPRGEAHAPAKELATATAHDAQADPHAVEADHARAEDRAEPSHHAEPADAPAPEPEPPAAPEALVDPVVQAAPAPAKPEHGEAEPLSLAPSSDPPAPHDPRDLWPVAPDEVPAPRWARSRRKPNLILGVLRVILLLVILAAVAVGLLIITGTADGPTLLARAHDLPFVGSLLP